MSAKDCTDFANEIGWTLTPGFYFRQCCDSCHEDWGGGYDDMCEVYDSAGAFEGRVCCRVAEALDEKRGRY